MDRIHPESLPEISAYEDTIVFKASQFAELPTINQLIKIPLIDDYEPVNLIIPFLLLLSSRLFLFQEGPRYNALHIAAKAKNAEIASIILKTVSDPNTYVRLYGPEANDKSNVKCASLLLDLYLNTPDKTLQETPLHFASKHAATGVVEVLISYPECQKDRPNKYNQTPLDVSILGQINQGVYSSCKKVKPEIIRNAHQVRELYGKESENFFSGSFTCFLYFVVFCVLLG